MVRENSHLLVYLDRMEHAARQMLIFAFSHRPTQPRFLESPITGSVSQARIIGDMAFACPDIV
ncbi:hypothetical protein ASC96_28120 [Rhizobium sp. Root1204]|nr:hypothetical protein ASC96_28120 [Rhizobium sp. Root1204]